MRASSRRSHHSVPCTPAEKRPRRAKPSCSSAATAKSTSMVGSPVASAMSAAVVGPTTSSRPRTSSRMASSLFQVLARSRSGGVTTGSCRAPGNAVCTMGNRSVATHNRPSTVVTRPALIRLSYASWKDTYDSLISAGRVTTVDGRLWVATERLPMVQTAFPGALHEPVVTPPERERARTWNREDAIRELVRGRLEVVGPTTAADIADATGLPTIDVDFALAALEHEGFALRGRFSAGVQGTEWCERRLLARIHRYTLDRLRREIEPVAAADFLRFLFRWQRLAPGSRAEGPEGLAAVLDVLDGYELAAGAWESEVLPGRLMDYDPLWLDGLCLSGEIAWGRLTAIRNAEVGMRNRKAGPVRSTPIALFRRDRGEIWRAGSPGIDPAMLPLSSTAKAMLAAFEQRGALFFGDLVNATGLLRTEVEKGLGELVAWGLVSSDSFAGLRALLVPSDRRR